MQKVEIEDRGSQFYGHGLKAERDNIVDCIDTLMSFGLIDASIDEKVARFVFDKDFVRDEICNVSFDYQVRKNKRA